MSPRKRAIGVASPLCADLAPANPMTLRVIQGGSSGRAARRGAARLAISYAAFAALSTGANLLVQWAVVRAVSPLHLVSPRLLVLPALAAGTGTGLVLKYVLDKRFIFHDTASRPSEHLRKFSLYAMMGVVTTFIFWGSELLASVLSRAPAAMYWGGALGLVVGYVVKYLLDRRFVFTQHRGLALVEGPATAAGPSSRSDVGGRPAVADPREDHDRSPRGSELAVDAGAPRFRAEPARRLHA